ncbi:polysaccharide pyruvyl transferase family protein [Mangrovicoccus sp. HB161399]|uniref:polysaccharide pyruvyl transferase family protein n=1 Tax=Mangrovicoccus sp. HB161399 TaxID=2720392 RepID=UPI001557E31E|nr:polysaccharide pyruvyl transferase family protein [Mangrovicoccus sp. HB161399]
MTEISMSKTTSIPRIGIFTYHFSDNFGALMQAYGLRRWLMDQGCEAEFVNYHPEHVEAGGSLADLLKSGSLKSKAKIVYLKLSALQRKLFGNRDQIEMFHRFQSGTLGVSGPVLRTAEEVDAFLASPGGRFDMLICGSDQIWAPSQQYGIDPVYYLDFPGGAQGARRISYAPSFGRATLDPAYETEVAGYLAGFDGLSAREKSGVEIVETLAQRPTAWVPDPTILLGDYSGLAAAAANVGEGHVFCYALRTGQGIREVAAMAGEKTGGKVLSPYNIHRRWPEIGETVYPSPEQWIAHVAKASFVVSNSFHGTVFSILFRKPFLTVGLPGSRAALNERSKNLLSSLGLLDRFVMGDDTETVRRRLGEPVDWETAEPKLAALQASGRGYLRSELQALKEDHPVLQEAHHA